MRLMTNVAPLLWLLASAGAFFFVFKPSRQWPVVGTPARALMVFVLVFVGGAVLVAVTRPEDEPPPAPKAVAPAPRAAPPDPALVRAHPERYLTLFRVKADRNKAGAVLLTGAAINTSGLPIREPRLTCRMSKSGTPAGTVTTVVHETVPAGGRLIFAAINLGLADGAWDRWACAVAEAKID
ncbi:hypothetical protein [Caulobacter sp. 1776]|uniref:hypothetical protein n=1 Tax=Caulobacter sp. 1776 TaxID=3156420 RepID=UPI00339102B5